MTIYWGAVIGFLLGFGFGVGCALAVQYSIYLGGYRAALRDAELPTPPERLIRARAKLERAKTTGLDPKLLTMDQDDGDLPNSQGRDI